jgi:hypothetical protein
LGAPRFIEAASRPNKPMHPTRINVAVIINLLGGRVIGSVRPLVAEHEN